MLVRRIIFFHLLIFSTCLFAEDPDSTKNKTVKIYPLPAFGYAPETRWYVGAVALINMRQKADTLAPQHTIKGEINYTQNKQLIFNTSVDIHFVKNLYRLLGENGYYKFPENFWGFGINTIEVNKINYDATRIELDNSFFRKNKKAVFFGIRYRYHRMKIGNINSGNNLNLEENNSFVASGTGPRFLKDTRDNILNPSKGFYFSFSALYFNKIIGSRTKFSRYDTDFRFYYAINKTNIIAVQAVASNLFGTAPFRMTPLIGNDGIMRGYYPGRYRDANMAAFQGEYRKRIWKFLGAVAFGGSGTVFNTISSKAHYKFRPSYGGGLRFRMDKKDNINLRFDYGIGYQSNAFYVAFGESF